MVSPSRTETTGPEKSAVKARSPVPDMSTNTVRAISSIRGWIMDAPPKIWRLATFGSAYLAVSSDDDQATTRPPATERTNREPGKRQGTDLDRSTGEGDGRVGSDLRRSS